MGVKWEDESTYVPPRAPTPEEADAWRRDPRNHVTPGLQIDQGPTHRHRQINPPRIDRTPTPPPAPRKGPTLH